MGVENIMEILVAMEAVLGDAAKAKADDGSISISEYIGIALGDASKVLNAVMGADQAFAEGKDIDAAEAKMVAEKTIAVAKAFVALYKAA